jgi:hypothetical protein
VVFLSSCILIAVHVLEIGRDNSLSLKTRRSVILSIGTIRGCEREKGLDQEQDRTEYNSPMIKRKHVRTL